MLFMQQRNESATTLPKIQHYAMLTIVPWRYSLLTSNTKLSQKITAAMLSLLTVLIAIVPWRDLTSDLLTITYTQNATFSRSNLSQ